MANSTDDNNESTVSKKKPVRKKKPAKKRKKTRRKKARKKKTSAATAKGAVWTFPKNTLEDALRIARAIEDKNAGNPMRSVDLCKAVGFNQPDWRYLDLLKSANLYGLVSGTGTTAIVRMETVGEDVVAPSSSIQRQQALLNAFRNVDHFRGVEDFFGGKRIPEDEFFENTLVRDFNIPRDRVGTFIDVFTENLRYLKLFDARRAIATSEPVTAETPQPEPIEVPTPSRADSSIREFLDTCFVMMPFGDWFDRYYKDIYVHAIKEAGFEPIRADELFSTGTVVEQIWEQIRKSTVLLADLSGKNANVFYELGLSHAALKPVVFTASNLEDIPFDLRHLRVIIYDVREPEWAEKLGESVTDFLKNAKADPTKSIPQPFREAVE